MTYIKLDEAIAAVEGERLNEGTGSESDAAYERALDHALQAIRALPTVSDGWEDIATAPRDGTLVLLFEPHSEGGFAFVGCNNLGAEWFNNLDMKDQNPTHWKHLGPLPAPPTIGE